MACQVESVLGPTVKPYPEKRGFKRHRQKGGHLKRNVSGEIGKGQVVELSFR